MLYTIELHICYLLYIQLRSLSSIIIRLREQRTMSNQTIFRLDWTVWPERWTRSRTAELGLRYRRPIGSILLSFCAKRIFLLNSSWNQKPPKVVVTVHTGSTYCRLYINDWLSRNCFEVFDCMYYHLMYTFVLVLIVPSLSLLLL